MDMASFTADWLHCDQLSNYVARMVSHDRRDPVRHSNLLSSALNELLEMSFRSQTDDGDFVCNFYRRQQIERIELIFPCPPEQRQFYKKIALGLKSSQARANYLNVITNDAASDGQAILLGLAVNYDAEIQVRDLGVGTVAFIVDLPLERLLN
ncbi:MULTISPECIES: ubiquinone biosynthesis methyltransferase UbiE [Rhizobium]|nr:MULTISPECIES: ubiquinone biosynthesis methyltransferase UbiE [Rhizobium]